MPSVFDADVILLAEVDTFDAGDDGDGSAVVIEPNTAWMIRVRVGPVWTGTTPVLDVTVEFSSDGGSTWRESTVFPQIAEVDAETNGQVLYYAVAVAPQAEAGETTVSMRVVTLVGGASGETGTTSIEAMAIDLPGNFPTGIVGYNTQILPTRRPR